LRLRIAIPSKEMLVGVIFTVGCALPALNRANGAWVLVGPVGFFAVLASLNCWAIERWEAESQGAGEGLIRSQVSPPRRTRPGAPRLSVVAGVVALAGLLLAAGLAAGQARPAALMAAGAASAMLLALLDRLRLRLTPLALRAAADLVLLTPALLAPAAWLLR
jgi:hypothetical protein